MIRVKMHPHPTELPHLEGGISHVVLSYAQYFPLFDVRLVEPSATSYDIIADHAGAARGKATVAHNHGLYWTADMPNAKDNHYRTNRHVINAIRHAKITTVPSRWIAHNIARDMHFLPTVVPHGIDWDEWQTKDAPSDYILWNKNRAADVCDPRPMQELAKLASNHRFISTFGYPQHNVKITGRLPFQKMKSLVQHALVYLATTKETFGIGTLEAMASGVPVLGYDYGGTSDLVIHKETGYLAQPGNVEDLMEGLNYCIKHRARLSRASRQHAKSYTWEAAVKLVSEVYQLALTPSPPTVSIVIPCYNYGEWVGRAIESALAQTHPIQSIIVVDDGSDDSGLTKRVVSQYKQSHPSVHYIRQDNAGVAHARNHGASLSDSKYICFLDADDFIMPDFIATLVKPMEADSSLGVTYTSLLMVDRKLRYMRDTSWPPACDFDQQVSGKNQVPTCNLIRRTAFERAGGYRQRYAPQGCGTEDAELWLRLGADGWGIQRVSTQKLFHYTYGGYTTNKGNYQKLNWIAWHPWTRDKVHPFASIAKPEDGKASHPVRQYDEPEVSVVIPVGPLHTHLVIDALDSLEAQTFRKWEAIVVNDSGQELDLSPWPYVTVVTTEGGKGAGYARNRGTEVAQSPYVVYLDADDFLQSLYLERTLAAAKKYPGHWIYTDMYIHKSSGELEVYRCDDWDVAKLWRRGIASVTSLYPIEFWKQVGGFDEQLYREDWDFHLSLAKLGLCGIHLAEPLFTYRHATGDRRRSGSRKREIVLLHEKYNERELIDMCRSCGKQRIISSLPPNRQDGVPTNWSTKADEGWPAVEFIGKNKSDMVFRGPTGRRYTFGDNQYHRVAQVHPDDVAHFMRMRYFKAYDGQVDGTEMTADPIPKQAKQPMNPKLKQVVNPDVKRSVMEPKKAKGVERPETKRDTEQSPETFSVPEVPVVTKPVSDESSSARPARPIVPLRLDTTDYLVSDLMRMDFSDFTSEELSLMIQKEQAERGARRPRKRAIAHLENWRQRQEMKERALKEEVDAEM